MTRILNLYNRARSVKKYTKNINKIENLEKSIELLKKWIKKNKKSSSNKTSSKKLTRDELSRLKTMAKKNAIYAPEKYFIGLDFKDSVKRLKRMKEGQKKKIKDKKHAYRPFETDYHNGKVIKTKLSGYTKQWRSYYPGVTSMKDKSSLTGVPIEILEKINSKGMAAWRTGHRPGANSAQWGHARVNSFLVKGKTFYTADKLQSSKIMNTNDKKMKKAQNWFDSIYGVCDSLPNKKIPKFCHEKKVVNLYR